MSLRRRTRVLSITLSVLALALLIFPQQAKKPVRIINTDPELRLLSEQGGCSQEENNQSAGKFLSHSILLST